MSEGTLTTEVGFIVKEDPTLDFSPQGHAICKFSIRIPGKNAKGDQPKVEARFVDVVAWRQLGENCAESLRNGDRVIVQGTLKTRDWEGRDGQTRTNTELNAWNVGPDLSYATATVVKIERNEGEGRAAAAPAADGGYGEF